jgi:muramoyltetrapeptide carboxypeptidase LdcA involved in peptidoglycan recycling
MLQDFENMGVLSRRRGLRVGRPLGYAPRQKADLPTVILERTARYDFPIVTDMDFGHTDPTLTLPIGVRAAIDIPARTLRITQPAVSPAR